MSIADRIIGNRRKEEEKDKAERERKCADDITATLKMYQCAIEPYLDADAHMIRAQARVVALPELPDAPVNTAKDAPTPPQAASEGN